MADQVHPLLREPKEDSQEHIDLNINEPTEDELEENLEEESQEQQESESPTPDTQEEEYYKLNKKNVYKDFERLSQEDAAFRNNLNTFIGRKAQRQYAPKVAELEAQLAVLRGENRDLVSRTMTEEEIGDRVRRDPQFAAQWHAPREDPEIILRRAAYERSIDQAVSAVDDIMPVHISQQFVDALKTGHYNILRDANEEPVLNASNQPIRVSSEESFAQFQTALNRYARWLDTQSRIPTPKPENVATNQQPKPKANPKLAEANPDLTPPGGGTGKKRMSMEEYKKLTPPEKMAMFSTNKDFEDAVASGVIY